MARQPLLRAFAHPFAASRHIVQLISTPAFYAIGDGHVS